MMMDMGTLHISDADLARDPYAVLAKVEEGVEVIVERNHRPVATIRTPKRSGRPISACIASAKSSSSNVILDGGFGKDVEEGIRERSQSWNPPLLGLILDSSVIIAAERKRQTVEELLTSVGQAFGEVEMPSRP